MGMLSAWQKQKAKLRAEETTKEQYDKWRYNYPRIEAKRFRAVLDAHRAIGRSNNSK